MKKKILALVMCVAMCAIAVVGGTLAYFTDTDAQENVFVVGNVKIDLYEDFGDNDGIENLVPATGSAQDDTLKNGIEKEVYVENTGSEKAYVRVHIAIPQILDNGWAEFNASKNVLHFNYSPESVEEGKWNWSKGVNGTTGSNWNYYTAKVDEIWYNVYVVTYETALERGDVTVDAMSQVYLDSEVTNEDITSIKEILGNEWKIYVVAEAGQADGFDDAYTALNTQFGVPGEYAVNFDAAAEDKKFVEGEDERLTSDEFGTSVKAEGVLASATVNSNGTTKTFTLDGATVEETTNPYDQTAYWLGYLNFTVPSYGDAEKATFTRNGVEKSFWECKDTTDSATIHTMQAWVPANEADKDANITYTFDWDGDGIYEAVYQVEATNLNLVKPAAETANP